MESRRTVRFRYTRSPEYRILPANGVYGGPTPSGDIIVHFFVDSVRLPNDPLFEVRPDGSLGPEIKDSEEQQEEDEAGLTVSRELQVAILLSSSAAETLSRWLADKLETLRKSTTKPPDA